jgi:hypothetical protein
MSRARLLGIARCAMTFLTLTPLALPSQEQLSTPRRPFAASLALRWQVPDSTDDSEILLPAYISFSTLGLLVSDASERAIFTLNSATGEVLSRRGRYGRGPLEFVRPPLLVGSYDSPMVFEAPVGRVHRLGGTSESATDHVARTRPWQSACVLGDGSFFLQAAARPTGAAFYRSNAGSPAGETESIEHPIVRLRSVGWFARQTRVTQLDDETCALLPSFHQEFAVVGTDGRTTVAFAVESLPPAEMHVSGNGGPGTRYSMKRGAARGASDAHAWRGFIVLLFQGRSPLRGRLLDIYSRADLSYRGSLVLPFRAERFAVRGDSLAVIGERDGIPVVAGFIISSNTSR